MVANTYLMCALMCERQIHKVSLCVRLCSTLSTSCSLTLLLKSTVVKKKQSDYMYYIYVIYICTFFRSYNIGEFKGTVDDQFYEPSNKRWTEKLKTTVYIVYSVYYCIYY